MKRTAKQVQNDSNVKAFKRARELRELTRKEPDEKLDVTTKAVEKYENGRDFLPEASACHLVDYISIDSGHSTVNRGDPNTIEITKRINVPREGLCRSELSGSTF
jgi:DNA-binding XRE family transcriptional regulator